MPGVGGYLVRIHHVINSFLERHLAVDSLKSWNIPTQFFRGGFCWYCFKPHRSQHLLRIVDSLDRQEDAFQKHVFQ